MMCAPRQTPHPNGNLTHMRPSPHAAVIIVQTAAERRRARRRALLVRVTVALTLLVAAIAPSPFTIFFS